MGLSSCSETIYNNKDFARKTDFEGKQMAILPAVVMYNGRHPEKSQWYKTEQLEAMRVQQELENFYISQAGKSKRGKYGIVLIPASVLNEKMINNTKKVSWDSLSNAEIMDITGAALILRSKLIRTRIMSKGAALAINAGSSILSGILSNKNVELTTPTLRESELEYSIELVDLKSGLVLSSYTFDPNISDSGKTLIRRANRAMAKKSLVYVKEP